MSETFTPARPLARHCAELTTRSLRPEDRAEHLAIWRRDLARELAADLAELLPETKLAVTLGEGEEMSGGQVFDALGPVAANSLLRCGADGQTALLSCAIETAIALTDRSFGGSGEPVLDSAETLPRSAGMLIEQVARIIASAISRVSAGGGIGAAPGDVIVRSESAKRLKPFPADAPCTLVPIELIAADGISWNARLAFANDGLESLLPGLGRTPPRRGTGEDDATGRAAAFAAIPLTLEAVLAEFDLSLARLDQLAPGQQIPLSLAREIPLRLGTQIIARGSLGTWEDRMALRLTSVPHQGVAA